MCDTKLKQKLQPRNFFSVNAINSRMKAEKSPLKVYQTINNWKSQRLQRLKSIGEMKNDCNPNDYNLK